MKKTFFTCIALSCMLIATGYSTAKRNPITGEWKIVAYIDPTKTPGEEIKVSSDESYTLRLLDPGIFYLTTDCNTISGW